MRRDYYFRKRIDKLIENQYNGLITFEECVARCNDEVNQYKYDLFSEGIIAQDNWKLVTKLRMYMLMELMRILTDWEEE